MRVAGDAVLHAPVQQVWTTLLDPDVLVATLPGCERLELTGENAYAMTLTAGIASIKDTYAGTVRLTDLVEPSSLVLNVAGSGASGTISARVDVALRDNADGTTGLHYDADATVGGMIGGVGQRMLAGVSRRLAAEFFGAVDGLLTQPVRGKAGQDRLSHARPAVAGAVWPAPDHRDFVRGALLGGALVLAGVLAGALLGRRRG